MKSHSVKSPTNFLLAVVLCFVLGIQLSYNQENTTAFDQDIASLTSLKPTRFATIDFVFRTYSRDSAKMKSLIKTSKINSYTEGENYGLNALGTIYRNISHYEKSIKIHKQANELANITDNIEFKIISLNNIGVAYRRMDLVKPALDFHTKALDFARSIKDPSKTISYNIAVSQNSIGNIYLILEQYELALKQF